LGAGAAVIYHFLQNGTEPLNVAFVATIIRCDSVTSQFGNHYIDQETITRNCLLNEVDKAVGKISFDDVAIVVLPIDIRFRIAHSDSDIDDDSRLEIDSHLSYIDLIFARILNKLELLERDLFYNLGHS
jgi:hypothetical protein